DEEGDPAGWDSWDYYTEGGWIHRQNRFDEYGQTVHTIWYYGNGILLSGPHVHAPSPPVEDHYEEHYDEDLNMWTGTLTTAASAVVWKWVFTDPLDPDTDGDGMPDGWEYGNWLHPDDPDDA